MAKSYQQIQNSIKLGNVVDWTNALNRLNGIPIDATTVYDSFDKAVVYAATDPVAYEGQLVTVTENGDTTVYVITPALQGTHKVIEKVEEVDTEVEYSVYIKKVGTIPTGDDASITVTEDGRVAIKGFADASADYVPHVKVVNGVKSIEWVPISQIVEGDTNTVTKVEVAEGSALSIEKEEDVNTDTVTYTLDVAIPEYAVKKTTGTGVVTYELTKDGTAVAEQIVVPNAYDDSELDRRLDDAESDISDLEGRMDDAEAAIENHGGRLDKIEAFFGAADKDGEDGGLNDALDTLVEIQNFLNGEGGTVDSLLDSVAQNAADIDALEKTLAKNGDFEKRVAGIEADVAENAGAIEDLVELTGTEGAIRAEIKEAKDQADKGVADAAKAQATANTADGKAADAQSRLTTLENTTVPGVKTIAENAGSEASRAHGRLDTAEADIDALEAIVKTGDNTNANLRNDITELQGIVKTGANANATLRNDLKNVSDDLADLADAVNDEETGLAKTKEIADNAGSEAARANGRLDTAEGEIDALQEIVDSGEGKTIRDDVTALQNLTGHTTKGNEALYNAVTTVTNKVNDASTGLAKTKEIADGAAGEASRAHGRIDVVDDIVTGYTGKNGDTVKADVNAAKQAASVADGKAVAAQGAADAAQGTANAVKAAVENTSTGLAKTKEIADGAASEASRAHGRIDVVDGIVAGYTGKDGDTVKADVNTAKQAASAASAAAGVADGKAVAAQGTADAVKAAVENANTGLAKTKEIADNAAAKAADNAGRLDLAEDAIDDLEAVVYDASKGNEKLRTDVNALQTLTGDSAKGNVALYNEVTRVAGLVDNASTGLAKTKEIADNAAATASANDGRLDTIEGNYVRIGADKKLYNGKDGDVIVFNCGSASVNI